MYIVLSYQLAWIASLLVFLSSNQQTVSRFKPQKTLAWCLFTVGVTIATLFLMPIFHWLAASLQVLMIVMLSWVGLALGAPYARKFRSVFICGTLFFSLSALIGVS